jgi:VIT1/CCC1 family predicted Fe2+/Mn2+ transporter
MDTKNNQVISKGMQKTLVIDELFDLSLYKRVRETAKNDLAKILDELILAETKHVKFWQEMFNLQNVNKLPLGKKIKLEIFNTICVLFGERAVFFILEAIEVYGIRKYLKIWNTYKDTEFSEGVREVLQDELQHEGEIISSATEKKISADKIRNAFLGFNDGLVEVLGAIAGFYVAFQNNVTVVIAGLTVAIAGSISMVAGVYVSESSEHEIEDLERAKKIFLGKKVSDVGHNKVIKLSFIVGISYIVGALIPLTPTLFGSRSILLSAIGSAVMIIIVSYILSFISGMDIKKRIMMNLGIIFAAIIITSSIGFLIKEAFGVSL